MDFIIGVIVSIVAVVIHYEAFNLLTLFIEKRERLRRHHMLVVMMGIIIAHLLEAAVFGAMFWVRKEMMDLDVFNVKNNLSLLDYYNFSLENYTSLGYGDLYIEGSRGRFLSAFESLIGLILISWSASFMFLIMSKDWEKRLVKKES